MFSSIEIIKQRYVDSLAYLKIRFLPICYQVVGFTYFFMLTLHQMFYKILSHHISYLFVSFLFLEYFYTWGYCVCLISTHLNSFHAPLMNFFRVHHLVFYIKFCCTHKHIQTHKQIHIHLGPIVFPYLYILRADHLELGSWPWNKTKYPAKPK